MSEAVRLAREGAAGRILVDRGAKKNAFTCAMWARLATLLEKAAAMDIRLLRVESAAPGIFSAGADLAEFAAMASNRDLRREGRDRMRRALDMLAAFPRPTVAVISGPCMGAGLALAAACDLRIADATARFAVPPAKLGLVYMQSDLARLVALVGVAETKRLVFTARTIDAAEALRIGLVEELVTTGALSAAAERLGAEIAAGAPASITTMKTFIERAAAGEGEDTASLDAFLEAYDSPEFAAGLAAFRRRRN
ncbi:MAG: enoyl-CoA hydratase/isomerase family protein [Alphaproteobacteria bacterium]|nr:MAG: enoyl-CoA hydratase/isomerase family protein [Alphaproteobacteria bacterium]